jgi:hypothetical protein
MDFREVHWLHERLQKQLEDEKDSGGNMINNM